VSLARLWLLVALALPALVALLVPMPAVDLAYQVRTGDLILATRAIPTVDSYTFTVAGQPWTDQQWLSQVLLAIGHRFGGWELLAIARAVLVAAMTGLLVLTGRFRGASLRTASVLALLAFLVSAPALALRPQLFAIVVFAGMLALVAGRQAHPRAFLAAPLLVVLWANLHGSFVLAPLLLGYAWLEDVARHRPAGRPLGVLIVGVAATFVTPFGPGVWAYAAGIGADPLISQRVSEWQRTSPLSVTGALFYASVVGAAAVAWRGRAKLVWPDALWLAGLAVIGVWAVRGAAWWPAGAVLVVAAALASKTEAARGRARTAASRRLDGLLVAALGIAIVAALPWWRPADPLTGRQGLLSYAPSGLAAALPAHAPSGMRVFVPQTWGSWFEWAVPDALYFVDSRFELFPAQVWADNDAISGGGQAALEALDRWQVAVVVLPTGWTPPAGAWTTAYEDDDGSILVRPAQAFAGPGHGVLPVYWYPSVGLLESWSRPPGPSWSRSPS
jgi:hypothetical protein